MTGLAAKVDNMNDKVETLSKEAALQTEKQTDLAGKMTELTILI